MWRVAPRTPHRAASLQVRGAPFWCSGHERPSWHRRDTARLTSASQQRSDAVRSLAAHAWVYVLVDGEHDRDARVTEDPGSAPAMPGGVAHRSDRRTTATRVRSIEQVRDPRMRPAPHPSIAGQVIDDVTLDVHRPGTNGGDAKEKHGDRGGSPERPEATSSLASPTASAPLTGRSKESYSIVGRRSSSAEASRLGGNDRPSHASRAPPHTVDDAST